MDRDELRDLLKQATPGPWIAVPAPRGGPLLAAEPETGRYDAILDPGVYVGQCYQVSRARKLPFEANGDLICAAVNALPGLLDALDRAEKREAKLKRAVWEMGDKLYCPECPLDSTCDGKYDCQTVLYPLYTGEDGPPEGAGDEQERA